LRFLKQARRRPFESNEKDAVAKKHNNKKKEKKRVLSSLPSASIHPFNIPPFWLILA